MVAGQTVNLLPSGSGGSTPSLPTERSIRSRLCNLLNAHWTGILHGMLTKRMPLVIVESHNMVMNILLLELHIEVKRKSVTRSINCFA